MEHYTCHDFDRDIDLTRITFLALVRNASLSYELTFKLSTGQYQFFVYDIEYGGTISNGINYPAFSNEFQIERSTTGKCVRYRKSVLACNNLS